MTLLLFLLLLPFGTVAEILDRQVQQQYLYAFCSDGSRAVSACFPNFVCNLGYRCDSRLNLCCTPMSLPLCPDNSQAVAYCIQGRCGYSYYCTSRNLCCSNFITTTTTNAPMRNCPSGAQPLGFCTNNLCRSGYFCNGINNVCCPVLSQQCPDGSLSSGTCFNGRCGSDYSCSSTGFCCPNRPCQDGSVPYGTCFNSQCGTGLFCTPARYCCPIPQSTCPSGIAPAGTCINGVCSLPYFCVTGMVCCIVRNYKPTGSTCKTVLECKESSTRDVACIDEKCVVF